MGDSILDSGQRRLNLKNLTEEIAKLCKRFDCPEPGTFLGHVMAGFDPRESNVLARFLRRTIDKAGRPERLKLSKAQTEKLYLILDTFPNFDNVDLATSIEAAKQLMQFLYAKMKTVEVSGEMKAAVGTVDKMTKKDFKEFLETFDKEY